MTNPTVALRQFAKVPKKSIRIQIYLHSANISNVLHFQVSYLIYSIRSVLLILHPFLQDWGDYTDMSQGVYVYVTYASDVLLICWFGTQLTQHVRQNILL
jgi:hypothetical protein